MLPKVILHNAVSVDGAIDGFPVDLGMYYGLISRWQEDATLVGSETVLHPVEMVPDDPDDEEGPLPSEGDGRPLIVVPDSRGRVRSWNYFRRLPYWRGAVALCSRTTPAAYFGYLERKRVDCIVAGEDHVDYRRALEELSARYGIRTIRVDSGGTLNGALLRDGLVDEVSVVICPELVGKESRRSLFRLPSLDGAESPIHASLLAMERLGQDAVWLRYAVARRV